MQRFMKWRYGAALIIATLAVVACSEATKNPVEPGVTVAAGGPAFLQQGDVGQCMGDDAVQFDGVPGFGTDPTAFNCTANDVRIANARTLSGTPINCTQGQNIVVDVVADVVETSTSARTDIGIWIANAGGTSAETGSCAFFFLPVNGGAPIENLDGDACGDLEDAATVTGFSLSALNLVCDDPDHDGFISIPSCVSWTEPGGDRVCNGTITGGERAGTLPGNKSKCNCEPFQVAINIQGTLTLKKVVVNDNGGSATATSFGITTSAGTPVTFGAPVTVGTTSTYTSNTFSVNTGSYTFSESDIAGYDEGTWSCTGAVASGTAFNAGSVTVPSGTNVVCTITNNDQAAHLIVIKHVINDNGGTAVASAFTNTIGGVTAVGGQAVTGAESPGVDKTLSTVGAYTVTEGAHVGYTVSYSTDCNGTIALGQTKTCTVTNDDNAASLTIIKHVINDNGGTAVASAFTNTIGGVTAVGGQAVTGAESPGVTKSLSTVGAYTVTEGAHVGYAVSYSADCNGTIALGESKTCTVTNNDIAAHLIVIKHVINDNGGTAVASAFTNTIGGVTAVGGQAVTGAESPGVDKTLSTVGAYTVTEGAHVGYTVSYSTDCNGTIALGETKTCTVTNDDQPATLIVKKIVIGDGATFDFTGTGTGITPSPFTIAVASNSNNTQTFSNISAGTKTITELAETGYLLTDLGCTTNDNTTPDGVIYDPALTSTVSTTLTLGGTVTCTFINEQVVGQTTRTQGFWSTHLSITHAVWFGGTSGGIVYDGVSDNLLCGKAIDTDGKLMGAFWSNISQTSTKTKRSSLDQARMRLLQQLIAAELNHEAFGSSPTGSISIADAEAAYCGTDIDAINAAASAMAAFNESGDSGVFTPGASANGKTAKTAANVAYWDILP
jgi:ribosome maturation factor RimP